MTTNQQENKEKKVDKTTLKSLGFGLGVGALAAATALVPKYSLNKGIRAAQRASKGKLHMLADWDKQSVKDIEQGFSKIHGFKKPEQLQYHSVDSLNKKEKTLDGAYYQFIDTHVKHNPKADISFNADRKMWDDVLQDKVQWGKLENSGSIPASEDAKTLLEKHYNNKLRTIDDLDEALRSLPKKVLFKDRRGYGGQGFFETSDQVQYYSPEVKQKILNRINKGKIVSNDFVDFEKIPVGEHAGKPIYEQRMHFMISGGGVKMLPSKTNYWTYGRDTAQLNQLRGQDFSLFDKFKIKKDLERIVKDNRQFDNQHLIVGADVIKDRQGKFKFIELNDETGRFYNAEYHPAIYRTVTGRDLPEIANAKAAHRAAVGTVVGAITAHKFLSKKKEEK
jgi:hypothetical protein